jgi:hypothetical protein
MSTISFPSRPPGYLERQGYVKPLWQVKLRRSDTQQDYVPDDEAYNLPAVKAKLESDKYSVSTIDHITLELTRTDELVRFMSGLKDPKRLSIKIFSYLIFRKAQKQLVWFGRLEKLPEGVDAYPWDKLKLTFTSPPGSWEDGDAVKDPNTETWHKNKHVTDLLLPKFLKEAFKQAGPGGGRVETEGGEEVELGILPGGEVAVPEGQPHAVTVYHKPEPSVALELRPFAGCCLSVDGPAAVAGVDVVRAWRLHAGPGVAVSFPDRDIPAVAAVGYNVWRNVDLRLAGGYGTAGGTAAVGVTVGIE